LPKAQPVIEDDEWTEHISDFRQTPAPLVCFIQTFLGHLAFFVLDKHFEKVMHGILSYSSNPDVASRLQQVRAMFHRSIGFIFGRSMLYAIGLFI
jgi:hypothetical protein